MSWRTPSRVREAWLVLGLGVLAGPAATPADAHGPTVRVLLVIDREAGGGLTPQMLAANRDSTQMLFEMLDGGQGRVVLEPPIEDDVRPARILDHYATSEVDGDDVLVVYYAGHGGVDPDHGPFLHTSGGDLLRSRLREAMMARKPRLAVILTDSCSNAMTLGAATRAIPGPGTVRILEDLFLEATGVVDLTAARYDPEARRGEFAWYTGGGGLFTQALTRTIGTARPEDLDRAGDGTVSWAELVAAVAEETDHRYRDLKADVRRRADAAPDLRDEDRALVRALEAQESQTPQLLDAPAVPAPATRERPALGLDVHENYGFGLVVDRALPGSPAERSGLEPGDILRTVAGRPVRTVLDLAAILEDAPPDRAVEVEGLSVAAGWRQPFRKDLRP